MHKCTEREMRETDRMWKTRGSQMLTIQLDTVTGFPSRLGEADSMLIPASTGTECEVGYELFGWGESELSSIWNAE